MRSAPPIGRSRVAGFRWKLFAAVAVVIGALTGLGMIVLEHRLAIESSAQLKREMAQRLEAVSHTRAVRQAVLTSICDALARKPRIHAALEDDALDLLYGSARQELRQILRAPVPGAVAIRPNLEARFYRFLDRDGAIIPPLGDDRAGVLSSVAERALPGEGVPEAPSIGYLLEPSAQGTDPVEVFTLPIISHATFQPIAALAVGFPLEAAVTAEASPRLEWGVEHAGVVAFPFLEPQRARLFAGEITAALASRRAIERLQIGDERYQLVTRHLPQPANYPALRELFLAPLRDFEKRRADLRRQVLLGGAASLGLAFFSAHLVSNRLARPVEALAVVSEQEHRERLRAETALDRTTRELERTARFSADASHQLKTPLTVLQAGLEELRKDPQTAPPLQPEILDLLRQTHRLKEVIDALLLLARMDAGHLILDVQPVAVGLLLDELKDDFSATENEWDLKLEVHPAPPAIIMAERRHLGLILQNLIENACKYNRPGGRIRVSLTTSITQAELRVGNTGSSIPEDAHERVFERFHRGTVGEQVPGYGLGLNLARDLARLHGGDLKLIRSFPDWTEFGLLLPLAPRQTATPGKP